MKSTKASNAEANDKSKEQLSGKKYSFFKKHKISPKITLISLTLLTGIIIGVVFCNICTGNFKNSLTNNSIINTTPDIDVTYLNTALKEASELTTAKLKINGLVDFKDTGIKILNKADFTMKYTADISAGIDMSKVSIKEDDINHENKTITVKIPKATVFKPNVYHGSEYIKFYDEKFALFNVNEKEDLSEALALAEKDAEKEAVQNGLLQLADEHSETLIKGILSDTINPFGYSVKIEYLE